eukprot:UN22930
MRSNQVFKEGYNFTFFLVLYTFTANRFFWCIKMLLSTLPSLISILVASLACHIKWTLTPELSIQSSECIQ